MFELLQKLNFDKLPLKQLKYMTSAGGKLNEDLQLKLINYLKNKKTLFYIMYGQTEASPRMSYLEPKFFEKKIGSIGKPLPGGRFILKDTFKNIQNKIIGEIVYKGKNVSLGYASSFKDLKKGDKNFNILKTGDLASKDKEGFYYIEGRKGREVATLASGQFASGSHSVTWNANDFSSGIYIVKMVSGNFVDSQKLMLIK